MSCAALGLDVSYERNLNQRAYICRRQQHGLEIAEYSNGMDSVRLSMTQSSFMCRDALLAQKICLKGILKIQYTSERCGGADSRHCHSPLRHRRWARHKVGDRIGDGVVDLVQQGSSSRHPAEDQLWLRARHLAARRKAQAWTSSSRVVAAAVQLRLCAQHHAARRRA